MQYSFQGKIFLISVITTLATGAAVLAPAPAHAGGFRISGVSPNSGPTSGGTVIRIYGKGLRSGSAVLIGASSCSNVSLVSSMTLSCITPANPAGKYTVRVISPTGSTATLSSAFTYVASVSPSPTPCPTPSPSLSPRPSPTPSPQPSATPSPQPSPASSPAPTPTPTPGKWMTGYFEFWNAQQSIAQIPWSKYTHVIDFATFPILVNGKWDLYLGQYDLGLGAFVSEAHGHNVKALLSIADNRSNYDLFGTATAPANIAAFVSVIVNRVNQFGYDGVDLDWELSIIPSQYIDLFTRLRAAMPGKIITAAMGNNTNQVTTTVAIHALVDQINIMCYDNDWESFAWHNDALFQNGDKSKMTCDWRVRSHLSAGVPASKLGIGIPSYGRRWTGATDPQQTATRLKDPLRYGDIVTDSSRWQDAYKRWDSVYYAEYLSIPSMNEFISYNGVRSIQETVKWIKAGGFGGAMMFTTNYEYIPSASGDARYPLSTELYNGLRVP